MTTGHTITIAPANAHIEIRVGGHKVAESDRALALNETGLPPRYYLPREDVRAEFLRPTARKTTCPFKGEASYWSAEIGDQVYEDLVWSYPAPIPGVERIAGLMCFYNERVELAVSDERNQDQQSPVSR